MKTVNFILLLFVSAIAGHSAHAATKASPFVTPEGRYIVSLTTTTSIRPVLNFERTLAGLFKSTSLVDEPDPLSSKEILALCPKESKLLYTNGEGLFEAYVIKDFLKVLKKDKSLVNVDNYEYDRIKSNYKTRLRARIDRLNTERELFVRDSTAEAARLEAIRLEEQRQQERLDQLDAYRKLHAHDWRHIPSGNNFKLRCEVCEDEFLLDSATILKMSEKHWRFSVNDTVFNFFHIANIPPATRQPKEMKYHLEAFADSIASVSQPDTVADFNLDSLHRQHMAQIDSVTDHYNKLLSQRYPNGYIKDWSWDEDYGNVSIMVSFNNTCKKTIKYITVFFKIFNDVDDLRCSGSVRGTGPVAPFDYGLWEWDSTRYWVSNDATSMRIYKVLINYMDGTSKTLSGKSLAIFRE